MPYRKKYATKKKTYKPRRKYKKKAAMPGREMPGFPITKIVKMRYVDTIRMDPAAGASATHRFRANSINDPDITGAGHQPLGHDQWAAFYNHYVVLGSKITCKFIAESTSQTSSLCALYTSDDEFTPNTAIVTIEQGLAKWRSGVLSTDGQSSMRVVNTYSAKKFFNLTDVKDNVTRVGAYFENNPSDGAVYTLQYAALNLLSDLAAIQVLVTIEYTVSVSEPKSLAQS